MKDLIANSNTSLDLWMVEQTISNAVPIPAKRNISGWNLYQCGGPIRRINSFNPTRDFSSDFDPLISFAHEQNIKPIIFRIPDMANSCDKPLQLKGFSAEGQTQTRFAPVKLRQKPKKILSKCIASPKPNDDWLAVRERTSGHSQSDHQIYKSCISATDHPTRFLTCYADDEVTPIAISYGVISHDLLVIEAVATDPNFRRRGCARQMVSELMNWAHEQGASGAVLQVEANNDAAIALYEQFGFTQNLYNYLYRVYR